MKNIAIKRAKNCPIVNDSLHPDFICEHADTSMFPEGFHSAETGHEILTEEEFNIEIEQNINKQLQFAEELAKKHILLNEINVQDDIDKDVSDKALMREFEEFKRWKESKKAAKEAAKRALMGKGQ